MEALSNARGAGREGARFKRLPEYPSRKSPGAGAPAASGSHPWPGAPGSEPVAAAQPELWRCSGRQPAFKGRCVSERVPGLDCSSCHLPHEPFVLELGCFRKEAILANSIRG